MPPMLPPPVLTGRPGKYVLAADTPLWRVHRSGTVAHEFEPPRMTDMFGGGRFDSVGIGGYSYLYASIEASTALAERFVRHLDFSLTGTRSLPRKTLQNQSLSVIGPVRELNLLRLVTGPDLAAIHQDDWLLTARGPEFDLTRRWAGWLRAQVGWADGFVWQSSIDQPNLTMVLFEDRCGRDGFWTVNGMTERLDDPGREAWLRHQLNPFGVELNPPAPLEKPKVFINYRSANGSLAAEMLDRELSGRLGEAAVFRDKRSIEPGAVFPPELVDKARGCEVLLVVVGPDWEDARYANGKRCLDNEDDWVRREIREAQSYGVTTVPVIVGMRNWLRKEDLPSDVQGIVEHQYLHLPAGFGPDDVTSVVTRLLERCRRLRG